MKDVSKNIVVREGGAQGVYRTQPAAATAADDNDNDINDGNDDDEDLIPCDLIWGDSDSGGGNRVANDDNDDDDEYLIPCDLIWGDSDSGGESCVTNDAISMANGFLGGRGVGSAALDDHTSGSMVVLCSLFSYAAATKSGGRVGSTSGAEVRVGGGRVLLVGM